VLCAGNVSCGGIFRNCNVDFLCAFAENLSLSLAFMDELCGAMRAIEIAAHNNWTIFGWKLTIL
jgi:hypothetical protein